MEIFILVISCMILLWITGDVSFNGLDLGERSSWLYGVIGFICGLGMGESIFAITGEIKPANHLSLNLLIGIIFGVMILFTGAVMRFHARRFNSPRAMVKGNSIKSLFSRLKKERNPTSFQRFLLKILEKIV